MHGGVPDTGSPHFHAVQAQQLSKQSTEMIERANIHQHPQQNLARGVREAKAKAHKQNVINDVENAPVAKNLSDWV
jgi:hypothetical protein